MVEQTPVAQGLESPAHNGPVAGSNPAGRTTPLDVLLEAYRAAERAKVAERVRRHRERQKSKEGGSE